MLDGSWFSDLDYTVLMSMYKVFGVRGISIIRPALVYVLTEVSQP